MEETPQITELALVLPLPPSINHLYATVNGRRILSRAGRAFKTLVAEAVESWLDHNRLPKATLAFFQGRYLALTMTFYFATALRRDLDSGLKLAQDALCEALVVNELRPLPLEQVELYIGKSRKAPGQTPQVTASTEDTTKPERITLLSTRKGRRRRHKTRSLDELTTRYQW
jgi:hypothetical protein